MKRVAKKSCYKILNTDMFIWNVVQDLIQAEDRAHRIGQEDSVLVQYLIQENSVDDKIWPLIQDKLNLLNKAGLGQDKFAVEHVQVGLF